jgi:Icc-related predicted phosphoesterase
MNVGCVDLSLKIMEVKPKISCFGHIHYGYGEKVVNGVQFFNAAVLGEQYTLENKPINIEYDVNTKEISFV